MTEKWRVWDKTPQYGEALYKRATGELPEMESSKKIAKEINAVLKPGDHLLDVGCGAGHYLVSLKKAIPFGFTYTGVDATPNYVRLAKEAFANEKQVNFKIADIFKLDLEDQAFDVVMCNNVLLHLPSIDKPLSELIRVGKRSIIVRFLCGDRTFLIKEVRPTQGREIDENGEPIDFNFYNIYSKTHVDALLSKMPRVKKWTIERDTDFNPKNIMNSSKENQGAFNASTMVGEYQANGYILQPWSILKIELN